MTPIEQLKSALCDPDGICCIAGSDEDRAIIDRALQALAAQPAQEPWCMKMNGCKTKCEDCPDEPAQEPVAWMREDATLRFAEGKVFAVGQPFYTTPQQRPWVGLTEAQFLEAVRLAENGNYLVAFVRIQEWLKEQNT